MSFAYTYSGPSVAAAFVTGVFNDADQRAKDKARESEDEFAAARGAVAQTPNLMAAQLVPGPPPSQIVIDLSSLLDRQTEIDALADDRAGSLNLPQLVSDVESFMGKYFPGVDAAVASARASLSALMSSSNFADGREVARLRLLQVEDRVHRDSEDREDELIRTFANRNYPLPPGELMHQLTTLRTGQLHALADASYEIDAAEAAREREALERTMRLLVSNRADAIKAFGSYLASACLAQYSRAIAETEVEQRQSLLLSDQLAQVLTATNRAAALQLRAGELTHGLSRQYLVGLDRLAEQQANAQLQAASAMAKVLGAQAATAYNNMRGSAVVSSSEAIDEL